MGSPGKVLSNSAVARAHTSLTPLMERILSKVSRSALGTLTQKSARLFWAKYVSIVPCASRAVPSSPANMNAPSEQSITMAKNCMPDRRISRTSFFPRALMAMGTFLLRQRIK